MFLLVRQRLIKLAIRLSFTILATQIQLRGTGRKHFLFSVVKCQFRDVSLQI